MPLPGREGHGARLLHGRLVRVQELPLAVHEEHRRAPPDAELADLLGRDAPLLPAAVADGVEVGEHLFQGQPQQLRQLPGRAELVVTPLEGRGQDLVALEELVRDLAQGAERLPQARFHKRAVVDVLRGLRAQRPLPRAVEEVDLLGELHDRIVLRGAAQLLQHRLLDVAGHLPLRQPVVLPLQPHVQRGHGQVIQPLVAPAVLAAAADPHRHVGQPLGVLLLEEGLAQLREVVVAVRRQRAHQLLEAAAEQDEVGGALADQRLRIVELTARRLPARELVVELPGARQGAVRPRELGGLPARPAQGQNLTAQPRGPWPDPGLGGAANLFPLLRPTHGGFTLSRPEYFLVGPFWRRCQQAKKSFAAALGHMGAWAS